MTLPRLVLVPSPYRPYLVLVPSPYHPYPVLHLSPEPDSMTLYMRLMLSRRSIQQYRDGERTPFARKLKTKRRFIGVELKEAYWRQASVNLAGAAAQKDMFDVA